MYLCVLTTLSVGAQNVPTLTAVLSLLPLAATKEHLFLPLTRRKMVSLSVIMALSSLPRMYGQEKIHLSFLCLAAVDQKHWKKLTGHFSNIMVCPHACLTHHAPYGFSPYGHIGNGCTDIVLLSHCSKFSHARWLMRQRKNRDMVRC